MKQKKVATANLHIRLPVELKRNAERIINALGLDTSSAIRLYFMQIALQQTIPFTLPKIRMPSPATKKVIADAMKDDLVGPFTSTDDFLRALYAES